MGAEPESDEIAAAEAALAALNDDQIDHDIAAVAYVRGTASPAVADAWRAAREQLRGELTAEGFDPSVALPGQGWDFTTGDGEITFLSATPSGETVTTTTRTG